MSLPVGSELTILPHDPKSHGTGCTAEIDDLEHHDSLLAFFGQQGRQAVGIKIERDLMSAQAREAADRRDDAWRAFIKMSRWHQHQWMHTRFFAGVWLAVAVLVIASFITNDLTTKFMAGALLLPCLGRALQVLSLTPSRVVAKLSRESDPQVEPIRTVVVTEPDSAA